MKKKSSLTLRKDVEHIEKIHQEQIEHIEKDHQEEIEQMTIDHQNEMDQIKRECQKQLKQMKNECQEKIIQQEQAHRGSVRKMQAEIESQAETIKILKTQIGTIVKKNEHEVQKLNDVIARNSMDIEKVQSSNKILSVPYSSGREFCGIINYLKRNSNIYNELNITSSSLYQYDRRFSPFNVIEYDDINAEFHTDNLANSWIRFELKNHKIVPKNYQIRTFALGRNASHMKSWVLECSNMGNEWEILDAKNDCADLNGENCMHAFPVNNPMNKEFKFARISQTGPNWRGKNFLKVNSIEFFGFII